MYSPRASPLAGVFNPDFASGPTYERPQSALSARPQSARNMAGSMSPRNITPREMMRPRNMSPRREERLRNLISPRSMTPRNLNEVTGNLAEWALRQSQMQEMLGTREQLQSPRVSEKEYLLMHRTEQKYVTRPQTAARLVPARCKQLDLPHQRVWREAAERKEMKRWLQHERQAQAMARAQAEAEAQAQAQQEKTQRVIPEEMKIAMVKCQAKLKEWFLDENKRFRKVWRAMDDDHNGWCDRGEIRTLPARTNLHYFCPLPVLEALIDLMDIDGDGRILYNEFVRVIMADDVFNP